MAALQQTPISLQTKLPPSGLLLKRTSTSSGLSFSASLPSIKLSVITNRSTWGAMGAKMVGTVAGIYAAALADVAKSNNTLDSTGGDVEKIEKIFSDPQVLDFFVNPIIDIEKKRKVLNDIGASSSLLPHTVNFLHILIDSKRIELIKEIVKEFEAVYNTVTDTELAVVTSVVKLESQHLAQIAKQMQKLTGAKNVRIKTVIDPSLVAGFAIRYGNTGSNLIDMSVKKQLDDIAAQLDLGDIQLSV